MFSRIRNRVTYTNVVVTLALVFAMTGGAFAAKHYLITSTNQISPKALKELQGLMAKASTTGPRGLAGPAGAQGSAGARGETGTVGALGAPGAPGKVGKNGKEGREGKEGEPGAEGSPWTAGGTLPPGASETGTWSLSHDTSFIPISFTIPLKAPLARAKIKIFEGEIPPEGCTGSTVENGFVTHLKAEPGFLCIYVRVLTVATTAEHLVTFDPEEGFEGAEKESGRYGLALLPELEESQKFAYGTWTVTEATG